MKLCSYMRFQRRRHSVSWGEGHLAPLQQPLVFPWSLVNCCRLMYVVELAQWQKLGTFYVGHGAIR